MSCYKASLAISLLIAGGFGCSLYHSAPLPEVSGFERGAPWVPEEFKTRVADIDHPILEPVPIDPADGLNPTEAALLAVILNPDLEALRATRREAAAGLIAAGLLPNPIFSAAVDDPYGKKSAGLTNTLGLSLSIDTQQIITRWHRMAAARGEIDRVDLDILWQEWQVAQQARLEATRAAWLDQRVSLARAQLADETQTGERLQHGLDDGDVTAERFGVQIVARESVRTNLVSLEQAQIESRGRLLALLGQPETASLVIEPPSAAVQHPLPTSTDLIGPCLERRLDLEALRRGYEAQDARVWQAVLEQFPNLTIGIARQRDESRVQFLGGFVTLGLPIFDRNQAGVALADSTRTRLRLEYAARTSEIRNTVQTSLDLLQMLSVRLPEVSAGIAPLESLENDEASAAESGDVDWLTYVTIRLALFDQQLQEAALSQLAAETQIGLATACGCFDGRIEHIGDRT